MKEAEPKKPHKIFLDSNIMRCPQVFKQYGEGIDNLARDLAIWIAWNGARNATLNVKQFREMFGYTHGYLFKPVTPAQRAWLELKDFPKEFKDLLGYTLAKMYLEKLNFPEAAPYSYLNEEGARATTCAGFAIIGKVTVATTRRGTSYSFQVSRSYLHNCAGWYQEFDLNEYLLLKTARNQAWPHGRRMFLHLAWKRSVWDEAIASKKEKKEHKLSQYDELQAVARFDYKNDQREAHELRQLLSDIGAMPRIQLLPELTFDTESGQYKAHYTRMKQAEAPVKHK